MRIKLGLTNEEIMNCSWISLQLQMNDFPYYDPKATDVITGDAAIKALDKYVR